MAIKDEAEDEAKDDRTSGRVSAATVELVSVTSSSTTLHSPVRETLTPAV